CVACVACVVRRHAFLRGGENLLPLSFYALRNKAAALSGHFPGLGNPHSYSSSGGAGSGHGRRDGMRRSRGVVTTSRLPPPAARSLPFPAAFAHVAAYLLN